MPQKTTAENSFLDFQKRAMAPFMEFNEMAIRSFERAARHGYEAAGEALEFSLSQAKAVLAAKDPQQLASKQAELATQFMNRQAERSNDWLKLAAEAQAEAGKWAQAANDELTAAARKSA